MKSRDEIRDWRRAKRAELRSRRVSLPRDETDRVRAAVTTLIRQHVPELGSARIGFCRPYRGEIGLRQFIRAAVADEAEAALPVVAERAQPLEFWLWRPHTKMQRGIWNIPIPADRHPVQPKILLAPVLHEDLREMPEVHERTIEACTHLKQALKQPAYPANGRDPGTMEDANHADEPAAVQRRATAQRGSCRSDRAGGHRG